MNLTLPVKPKQLINVTEQDFTINGYEVERLDLQDILDVTILDLYLDGYDGIIVDVNYLKATYGRNEDHADDFVVYFLENETLTELECHGRRRRRRGVVRDRVPTFRSSIYERDESIGNKLHRYARGGR